MLFAAIGLYWQSGGFTSADVKVVEEKGFFINGKKYKGKDISLGSVVDTLMQRIEASGKPYSPIVYSFKEMAEHDHVAEVFIGVRVDDTTSTLHKDYGFFYVEPRKVIRGHMNCRDVMVPKIHKAVMEYAAENDIEITVRGMSDWSKHSEGSTKDHYIDVPVAED